MFSAIQTKLLLAIMSALIAIGAGVQYFKAKDVAKTAEHQKFQDDVTRYQAKEPSSWSLATKANRP